MVYWLHAKLTIPHQEGGGGVRQEGHSSLALTRDANLDTKSPDQGSCHYGCEYSQLWIGSDLVQFPKVDTVLAFAVPPRVPA